ncbi:MAG: hypothetical protein E7294_09870 [Lachnospiraceae bacterium]|nr:hypothetical protein [Lachnospiraceae bacterium]
MLPFFNHENEQPHQGVYRAYLNSQRSYEDRQNDFHTENGMKKSSFALRFFLSILVFGCYLSLRDSMRQEVHTYIKPDYSDRVLEFMTDLTDTAVSEKTKK